MSTTTNLAEFDNSDLKRLGLLLNALREQGLPEDFNVDGVHPMMNTINYNIFLTNDDMQCAMMNGDKLESWYYCSECGYEGFKEDCQLREDNEGCNKCNDEEVIQ